jgi:hypothetical protein
MSSGRLAGKSLLRQSTGPETWMENIQAGLSNLTEKGSTV